MSSGFRGCYQLYLGQVRGEMNSPPLSMLEESNGGLCCGVEELVSADKGGADSCSV